MKNWGNSNLNKSNIDHNIFNEFYVQTMSDHGDVVIIDDVILKGEKSELSEKITL